ncbi:hypothetical protein GCM10011491_08020 [Brucella endophytica]|uniref:DUF1236 domain-containing protein n=1 Tax=Brucella endophytica TaxID=1963359 RepID=A0A916WB33_9HYPH|nr:DUF1236 domain-containing protein [Brucella endophytica]GGA82969.1 hypothetical protein GCM10011491_08020 [Brucella endophytica]
MKISVALSAALLGAGMIAGAGSASAQDAIITEVPPPVREYVIAHPVEPVVIEEQISPGYVIPETVEVRPVPDSPGYGYIYVNGEPVIVQLESRRVVYLQD